MKSQLIVALALCAAGCGSNVLTPTAPAATVTSLKVVADQTLLEVGSDQKLRALAVMSDGSTSSLTADLKWSTSNNSILDIAADGVVTAVSGEDIHIRHLPNSHTDSDAVLIKLLKTS